MCIDISRTPAAHMRKRCNTFGERSTHISAGHHAGDGAEGRVATEGVGDRCAVACGHHLDGRDGRGVVQLHR